ncbi:hypothetical protein GQ53DRAFT_766354 [Thozetella sp. PMI_491]|nr:hypothetical protein GQ53DRAFT_766354 [Thozetella sp. PMI_491]
MQLFKSIAFFALLSTPSLGEPLRGVRSNYVADVGKLEPRADPPAGYDTVTIGETRRALSGDTLFTNGLATCIGIVIRSAVPGPSKTFDKILAHISPTLCQTQENPSIDQQLRNIWALYDAQPFSQPQAIVAYPPANGDAGQDAFNSYVIGEMRNYAGQRNCPVTPIQRDQTYVNNPGGSRMWIDGSNQNIYWSTFNTPIA